MPKLTERLKNSWNAFMGRDAPPRIEIGVGSYLQPSRSRLSRNVNKSIVSTIYNFIAVDCAMVNILHVKLDEEDKYKETIDSPLNYCLTVTANIDQIGQGLIQDIVMSMLDEGSVAVVPVTTSKNPNLNDSFNIYELRTAKIIEWYPKHIKVNIYNDNTGLHEEMILSKDYVAIIENPFYAIMNEPNSLAQRLMRVLAQLDRTNEQNSSGKLDLIVQLPYGIRTPARQVQAEQRRNSIVEQLTNSQYGIAYIDASEKIIQLNRSLENNLWNQATELTTQLYNQFGLTENIFNGTANEAEQLFYYNRTIAPILEIITKEMKRKFLTKTAISQKQSIKYFKDPFKLVPVEKIAEIADTFTRNEIMSSNEIRSIVGLKPSDDPRANELINSNLNQASDDIRGVQYDEEGNPIPQDMDGMTEEIDQEAVRNNLINLDEYLNRARDIVL